MNVNAMKDPKGYLEPEQVEKILSKASCIRDYILTRIMFRTGIRVTEAINIDYDNILWEDHQIIIQQLKKRGDLIYRNIYLDEGTMDILKKYCEVKNIKSGRIFPITRQRVFQIFRSTCERARINKIGNSSPHPHHARHSFMVHGIKKGVDIRKMQLLAGHSNYSTTASYLNYGSKELREEYDKIWE